MRRQMREVDIPGDVFDRCDPRWARIAEGSLPREQMRDAALEVLRPLLGRLAHVAIRRGNPTLVFWAYMLELQATLRMGMFEDYRPGSPRWVACWFVDDWINTNVHGQPRWPKPTRLPTHAAFDCARV